MKNIKGIIGLVAFFAVTSVFGGQIPSRHPNYDRFIREYKGDIIDTKLNIVAPAFVYEAVKALRADNLTTDIRDVKVGSFLWGSIENVVNKHVNLPENRNNSQLKDRLWQSLARSLDDLARVQQPKQPISQPTQVAQIMQATPMGQPNYDQFVRGYKGEIITSNNMISPVWVSGAIGALRADKLTTDITDVKVGSFLWRSIENVVNYYANLPANRNNKDFKDRIWQSLARSIDEIARAQQPISPSARAQQPVSQPTQIPKSGPLSDSGRLDALRNFRAQTAQIIQTKPTYFYRAEAIQSSWLREALKHITANGRVAITMQNKANIQTEMAGVVSELMRQILRTDLKELSETRKKLLMEAALKQVEQFINAQVMRSRI